VSGVKTGIRALKRGGEGDWSSWRPGRPRPAMTRSRLNGEELIEEATESKKESLVMRQKREIKSVEKRRKNEDDSGYHREG